MSETSKLEAMIQLYEALDAIGTKIAPDDREGFELFIDLLEKIRKGYVEQPREADKVLSNFIYEAVEEL